jgi:hypothetical protein
MTACLTYNPLSTKQGPQKILRKFRFLVCCQNHPIGQGRFYPNVFVAAAMQEDAEGIRPPEKPRPHADSQMRLILQQ